MRKTSFRTAEKASVSLTSLLRRRAKKLKPPAAARAAGFHGAADEEAVGKADLVSLIVEAADPAKVTRQLPDLRPGEGVEVLADGFLSAVVSLETAEALLKMPEVERLQTKKRSTPVVAEASLDVGVRKPNSAPRAVAETGKGVLIGVVDSGFDLSHPMFRDKDKKLRVEGLLDQPAGDRAFTAAQLEAAWADGSGPGADDDGHGTHVASIAGGSAFGGLEGVAPGARFLLVKTDFRNTDKAVQWVFQRAGTRPCVVNLSLGHHWGAHDGTDAEERLHKALIGQGKVIVAAASNERQDRLHLGGRFAPGQGEAVGFDVLRQRDGSPPYAALTLWYDRRDAFRVEAVTPSGQALAVPATGTTDNYQTSYVDLELSRKSYAWSQLVQVQIVLSFSGAGVPNHALRNWRVRLACETAVVGRLDGWFANSDLAAFHQHPAVEDARTVGLPATGDGCLTVASHVSKNVWRADAGPGHDNLVVAGRSSPFSSQGPTRDGRWKPEVSAPGQYLAAALADRSALARWDERALVDDRLVTIEGTSMATPVVAGLVALLLQRKPKLTVDKVRDLLKNHARRDAHTGPAGWHPAYGYGKIDIGKLLAQV